MKFIVFEGVDGSGKTTLSKAFAEKHNAIWIKEPTFTSEEADKLNLKDKDSVHREVEFCVDRIKHQEYIKTLVENKFVVCDRYIWSGLAYCKQFNPSAYSFAEALYEHLFFIKPDVYVFVDTDLETCSKRRNIEIEKLIQIRFGYQFTEMIIRKSSPVIHLFANGIVEENLKTLESALEFELPVYDADIKIPEFGTF